MSPMVLYYGRRVDEVPAYFALCLVNLLHLEHAFTDDGLRLV
jgi:hypothetical protein